MHGRCRDCCDGQVSSRKLDKDGTFRFAGNFVIKNFRFKSGESLPELKIHYTTLGTAKRNARGDITNAALLLHGTSADGKAWLRPSLADELFAAGNVRVACG